MIKYKAIKRKMRVIKIKTKKAMKIKSKRDLIFKLMKMKTTSN